MTPSIFLANAARWLLVLHALTAFALGGACTHLALLSVKLLMRKSVSARLVSVYAQVIAGCFVAAFVLGLLLYPDFRYHVRGLFLDRHEPWASNLFDMKENMAALALPLVVGLFAVGRRYHRQPDEALVPWLAFLSLSVWVLMAFSIISGLVVTTVKGV